MIILITPPFQTPDEPAHFYRSYQISEGNLVVDREDGIVGGYLPESLNQTFLVTATNPGIAFKPDKKYSPAKTHQALGIKENQNRRMIYDFSSTSLYSPISYMPQASGVFLLRSFDAPPILSLYFAKITNLLAWIAMFSLAIKLVPRRKWAFVFVGLLPMSLFQAGSLSTDVMSTGLGAVFIASILYLQRRRYITKRNFCLLLFVAIAMVLTKQVMFVLLPLFLLIPNVMLSKEPKKAYGLKAILVVAPLIFLALWTSFVKSIDISSSFANGQEPAKQLRFVVENPESFINVLWNTSFFTWGDSVTRSLIGTFGWMDAPLSEIIVVCAYIVLFLLFVGNYQKTSEWLNKRQILLMGLVVVAFWGAVNGALYVYYSPVGYKIIYGLQGRYFIPILLLLIPIFYGSWLKMSKQAYRRIAIFAPITLLSASLITIFFRYYINNV